MKKPSDQKIKMCFIFSFEDLCKKKKKNIYYKKQQKPQTNKQKSPPPQNKHIINNEYTLYVQICIKIKPKLTPLSMDTITMA